ncbi:MAG: YybH family protein [Planctomycetaceae bacterium]
MRTDCCSRRAWTVLGVVIGLVALWHHGGRTVGVAAQDKPGVVERELITLLEAQRDAWNRGNIEEFLVPYWNSEKLTFSSGGEVRRGFNATRERYLKTFPDRKAMGVLDFSDLEVTELGTQSAMVLGTWKLTRDAGPLGGNFTLVVQRLGGEWKIIHDHTSRRME